MLEAVFSEGRGPSETSHHSLFKYAAAPSQGENSPLNSHLAPYTVRMIGAGFGPVTVCAAMFVFFELLLIQWTETALLLSDVCGRRKRGSED